MGLHRLKSFRVGVSVLFFALIAFLFLDFRNIVAPSISGGLLYLQFVPSLLKFVNAAALGTAGFIVIVILTVLFGRVYCSTVCPLGTLQDVISFVARKKWKRRDFQFSEPHDVLRYSLLTLTVLLLIAGSGFLLNLLDPFSSFGRIFSNLIRPVVLVVNNVAAIALEPLGVHTLYRVPWAVIAPVSAGISMAMLMLVAMLAATRGRLYCNTVCPVGALLGLLSKISFLQISIDPGVCKGCKLCEGVCKAGCIDRRKKTVDISRCIGCYNCFAVCPREGLRFENRWRRRSKRRLITTRTFRSDAIEAKCSRRPARSTPRRPTCPLRTAPLYGQILISQMQSFIRLESFNVVIVNSVFLNSESFGTVSNRP